MYINNAIFTKIIKDNPNELVCILAKFLWYSGARLVEALEIQPSDISLNSSSVRINNKRKRTRKYEYYREVELPRNFIDELILFTKNNNINKNERIFKFTPKTAIKYVRVAGESAGLKEKITPKMFRYSFAQNKIKMGIDDYELNYLLGNTDIKKTILFKKQILGKSIA